MNGRFLFRKRKRKWGFHPAWYHHAFLCGKAAHCGLFLVLGDLNMQLIQLLLRYLAGCAHHHILGVLVHGEGDDLPDAVLAGQQHYPL